jgi:hypothetical protein
MKTKRIAPNGWEIIRNNETHRPKRDMKITVSTCLSFNFNNSAKLTRM